MIGECDDQVVCDEISRAGVHLLSLYIQVGWRGGSRTGKGVVSQSAAADMCSWYKLVKDTRAHCEFSFSGS